jgi:integrase
MPRKRSGTIITLPDGRLQAILTLDDGSRKRIPPFPKGTSREMAREKAKAWSDRAAELGVTSAHREQTDRAKAAQAVAGTKSCAAWVETWHADRVRRGLTSALDSLAHWNNHLRGTLGEKHPRDWTADDFRRLSTELDTKVQGGAISWKTAVNAWGTATRMAEDACSSKSVAIRCRDDNPSSNVQGPDRGEKTARQYLYPSEVETFLASDESPLTLRRLAAVAVYTYARAGELRALTWDDVDVDRGVLSVTKAIESKTGELKATKSKCPRLVPIEPALLPLLRAMRAEVDGVDGAELVFPVLPGIHLARGLRRWLTRAGVGRRALYDSAPSVRPIRFHDLRSTGITWMAVRGDDPLRIQQRAGHTDFNTTQGYIREAEVLRDGFGQPFPPIPASLLEGKRSAEKIGSEKSGKNRPNIERETGFEPEADTESACFMLSREADNAGNLPAGEAKCLIAGDRSKRPIGSEDTIESALARALDAATTAGRWDVVTQIGAELQARRLARDGVPSLTEERKRRTTKAGQP